MVSPPRLRPNRLLLIRRRSSLAVDGSAQRRRPRRQNCLRRADPERADGDLPPPVTRRSRRLVRVAGSVDPPPRGPLLVARSAPRPAPGPPTPPPPRPAP